MARCFSSTRCRCSAKRAGGLRHEISGQRFPWRLPRLPHSPRRHRSLPAPGCRRAPAAIEPRTDSKRVQAARHDARRRTRAGHEHADPGRARVRENRRSPRCSRPGRRRSRRTGRAVHLRRKRKHVAEPIGGARHTAQATNRCRQRPAAAGRSRSSPPSEFAHTIRESIEQWGAQLVVIDSLNGYLNDARRKVLIIQLHELLTYLGQAGSPR